MFWLFNTLPFIPDIIFSRTNVNTAPLVKFDSNMSTGINENLSFTEMICTHFSTVKQSVISDKMFERPDSGGVDFGRVCAH